MGEPEPAPELQQTITNYTLIILRSSPALLPFPPRPPSLPHAKENSWKTDETQRSRGREPTLPLYSSNSVKLMRSLVNRWFPLIVWPLAGLQQPHRWRCYQYLAAIHPKVFLYRQHSCHNPISRLEDWLRKRWLAHHEARCYFWYNKDII